MACYRPNGALDTAFGSGTIRTDLGSGDEGYSVALQPDGKVVAGSTYNGVNSTSGDDVAVARYNQDGTLDTTFGNGGSISVTRGSNSDKAYSVAVQSDGKILVAGYSRVDGDDDFYLLRFTANGFLDTTFANGGGTTTDFNVRNDRAQSVAIQSDGKIVVAGYANIFLYGENIAVARYNPDGTLDTSFSGDGQVTTNIASLTSNDERAYSVAIQNDGKILVAGDFSDGTYDYIALLRYNTNGSLDTSFGPNDDGKALFVTTGNDHGRSVAVQPDGKILVAGYGNYGSGTGGDRFVLARFYASGEYEGHVVTPVGTSGARATSMAIQRDGKILVAGSAYNGREDDFALLRYLPNAQRDPTFGNGGEVLASVGLTDAGQGIALQSDGKIVVTGSSYTGGNDFALARFVGDPTPTYDPDIYEPNESVTSPFPITSTLPDLIPTATIHNATDHDWARWTLPATGQLGQYVSLVFTPNSGNLALEVYRLVGSSWVFQAASNTSTDDRSREDISMAGWPVGTYATHVYGISGGTNRYQVGFGYPPAIDLTDSPNRADADSSAFSLGSLSLFSERWTFRDLRIDTDTDQDWFSFTLDYVPLNGTYFRIDFDPALANLDISLWRWNADAPPSFVSNATSSGSGFEQIDLSSSLTAGTYLVKVVGNTAGTRSPSYSLAWDAPVGSDVYEVPPRNNTSSAPTLLGAIPGFRRYDDLSLHTVPEGSVQDVDIYSFSTSGVGQKTHSIIVETDYTDTPLEVNLYAMIGSLPRWVGSAVRSVDYTVSLEGLPSGNYLLEVKNQQAVPVRKYALNFLCPGTSSFADRFEPANNVAGTATNFTTRQGFYRASGLTLPASDVDWFKISLKSQGQRGHHVAIDFQNGATSGDLDLYLYNAAGTAVLASSLSTMDREYISLEGLGPTAGQQPVDYLVRIVGYNGATSVHYSLSLNLPGSDLFEQDSILDQQFSDSKAKAVALPGPGKPLFDYQKWSNLSIQPGQSGQPSDDDWFKVIFEGSPTANDYVEIRFDHADGDLGLEVQHGAQLPTKSESVGGVERVSLGDFTPVVGEPFYIRVFSYNGRGNPSYDLTVNGPGSSAGDWADVYQTVGLPGNTTPATATDLTPIGQADRMGDRRWNDPARPLSIHVAGDVDWYRFAVDVSSTGAEGDEVTIQFDHALGDIDLELYKRTGGSVSSPALTLVGKSVGVGNTHTVSLKDQPGGDYYLKVSGFNGATNPAYTLAIRAQWAPPIADVHELSGNNTRLNATNLGTIAGEWNCSQLSLTSSSDEDWYRFSMPVEGDAASQVSVGFHYRLGDVNLQLYDANGELQGTSNALRSNSETLSLYGKPLGDKTIPITSFLPSHSFLLLTKANPMSPSAARRGCWVMNSAINCSSLATPRERRIAWYSPI